jgi:ribosomal RNA-processing protein 1
MWMADKPKYQRELAERLASVASVLACEPVGSAQEEQEGCEESLPASLLYIRAFWETISREWTGLDRLRLNKFYQLIQEFMRIGFLLLREQSFEMEFVTAYFRILADYPLKYNARVGTYYILL